MTSLTTRVVENQMVVNNVIVDDLGRDDLLALIRFSTPETAVSSLLAIEDAPANSSSFGTTRSRSPRRWLEIAESDGADLPSSGAFSKLQSSFSGWCCCGHT